MEVPESFLISELLCNGNRYILNIKTLQPYLEWCFTIALLIVLLTEEFTDDESEADEFMDKPRLSRDKRI